MRKQPFRTVLVLFTRDLRLHDQPALAAAVDRAERIVPLFVLDDAVRAAFGAPNRVAFLLDSLGDHDGSLRRRGREQPRRSVLDTPERIELPEGVEAGELPTLGELGARPTAAELPTGGETAGRPRLEAWLDDGLARYAELADNLAAEATSRLSPYLHFGCVSAGEVVARALEREGSEPFVRRLCWRDFNHQLLAANPETAHRDLRPRAAGWRDDEEGFAAWREGHTGYPLVDAGMRQYIPELGTPDYPEPMAVAA